MNAAPRRRRVFVPYRVCLLGEHVDHQGGSTLSANVDLGVTLDFEVEAGSGAVEVTSESVFGKAAIHVDAPLVRLGHWSDYLKGVLGELRRRGPVNTGFVGHLRAGFPPGGLSSSAAVQIAYALALLDANDVTMRRVDLAEAVVAAERGFIGVGVGMLDPMTILLADRTSLLGLDCLNGTSTAVKWPAERPLPRLGLVYSGVARRLVDSPYNDRIEECRRAASALFPGATRLGDVPERRRTPQALEGTLARRARHFYGEIERVAAGAAAWQRGDLTTFAGLVNACGDSCADDFELGTPEVNELVAGVRGAPGVLAARFTGGGFGGAVFALLDPDSTHDPLADVVRGRYAATFPEAAANAVVAYCGFGPRTASDRLDD